MAVFEDMTAGLVADRLQRASKEHFVEGTVAPGERGTRRLLAAFDGSRSRPMRSWSSPNNSPKSWPGPSGSRPEATSAWRCTRWRAPGDTAVNLARGQTCISLTDGANFNTRSYNLGGRGGPDRTRMSLNAISMIRTVLLEGM